MFTMHYGRRRNPGFTVEDFLRVLREKGLDRMAYLVGQHPDVVEPFLGKIEARLIEKGILAAPAPAAPAVLSDREGWTQLADLVDSALADQPSALREALKQAFREEAAKAA